MDYKRASCRLIDVEKCLLFIQKKSVVKNLQSEVQAKMLNNLQIECGMRNDDESQAFHH